MTTLDVTLSASLQTTLSAPGVSAYAVYFQQSGTTDTPVWTTLDANGTVASNGTVAVALPETYISGKVYVIIQSQDPSAPQSNLTTLITSQADLNPGFASTNDFAYDSFEINLSGSSTDVANLTSINEFGLPLDLSVDNNGTAISSGYDIPASSIVNFLSAAGAVISTYSTGALSGDFSLAEPPSGTAGASLWAPFITSLEETLEGTQAPTIILSGIFNGANNYTPSLGTLNPPDSGWHNYAYYAYQLEFSATDGNFWLDPIKGSQVQGDIELTPADLEQIVFGPPGTVDIYTSMTAGTPFLSMNLGANNQWSAVLAKLQTGLDAGFLGAEGESTNPQVTAAINLDESTNWNALYAYGNSLVSTPYDNLVSLASGAVSYDQYASVFLDHSNSYGMPYTDLLTADYVTGGPQLDIYDTATSSDVSNIDLTVFANGETPSGYTTPTTHNYIEWQPTTLVPTTTIMGTIVPGTTVSNGYVTPNGGFDGTNVVLSIGSPSDNTALVTLNRTDSITLNILTAETPNGTGGYTPTWDSVTLDGATAGTGGLWQLWNISYDAGTGTYSAAADPTGPQYTPGTLLINQFPTAAAANATAWYQVVIGDKTYNLYTTTQNGLFDNTNIASLAGSLAIDGGGVISVPAGTLATTVPTMTLIFPVDTANTAETIGPGQTIAPFAPVAGTLSNDSFTAIAGQITTPYAAGSTPPPVTITTLDTDLAFAWTGENTTDPDAFNWATNGYSNKANANDTVVIDITNELTSTVSTITTTADLDGAWQTGDIQLDAGTYTITMQDFSGTDPTLALTPLSTPLTLIETGTAPCFAAGTRILTPRGEIAVEALAVGDTLMTQGGGAGEIIWIGKRTINLARHPNPETVLPVCIQAGALADGVPARDLLLSPDHALLLGAHLIPAKILVNGANIHQRGEEAITYYHVELGRHCIILAENTAVETYLETGNRGAFENGGAAVILHPDFGQNLRVAQSCAPFAEAGPEVESIRGGILARANIALTNNPDLRIEYRDGDAIIYSRSAIPAEVTPDPRDRRRLGVKIAAIRNGDLEISLDEPLLTQGWHGMEADGRWTDGAAMIPAALLNGRDDIEISLAACLSYPVKEISPPLAKVDPYAQGHGFNRPGLLAQAAREHLKAG